MAEKKYRITSDLKSVKFSDELTAEVELFREGEWKHPVAPGGWFSVDRDRIVNFINNFNRGVCGFEIPLEFNHAPNSKDTPGWITKMYEAENADGITCLFGQLKLTDREVAKRIKDGSLKYISPTVVSDYMDTASGQKFEVIRSATLTNYPHIKQLNPISVNFEEIQNKEEFEMKTPEEIIEKNTLELEDLDSITLEELEKGDIELEYLSEEQIKDLSEHFDMTIEQFQEKYPKAGEKGKNQYGDIPRIKLPAAARTLSKEDKMRFFQIFRKKFARLKDVGKATAAALAAMKISMEDTQPNSTVKDFAEKLFTYVKNIGKTKIDDVDTEKDSVTLEEMQSQIKKLEAYKKDKEFAEDKAMLETFNQMTPAVKKIAQTLLSLGRDTVLKFEDTDGKTKAISLHDLVKGLFEELTNAPTVNMFEKLSHTEKDVLDLSDNLHSMALKFQEEDPKLSYRAALDKAYLAKKQKKE